MSRSRTLGAAILLAFLSILPSSAKAQLSPDQSPTQRQPAAVEPKPSDTKTTPTPPEDEEDSAWERLFGRLHPALVHFPIGLIAGAAVFEVLSIIRPRRRVAVQTPETVSAPVSSAAVACLTLGALAAGLAAWSGWEYAEHDPPGSGLANVLFWHRWLGVAVTAASLLGALSGHIAKSPRAAGARSLYRGILLPAAVLTIIGGHLGGSMEYGSDFYVEAFQTPLKPTPPATSQAHGTQTPVPTDTAATDVTKVDFARDIQPILNSSCIECHGPNKMKGHLRLDSLDWIARRLDAVSPGASAKSDLLRRVRLDPADEDFMPRDRQPLTPAQIELISRWIDGWDGSAVGAQDQGSLPPPPDQALVNAGTPGDKNAAVLAANATVKVAGNDAEEDEALAHPPVESDFATPTLSPAQQKAVTQAIDALNARGAAAVFIGANSDAVDVNLSVLGSTFTPADFQLLSGLEPRLRWLNLSGLTLPDSAWAQLAQFREIHKLDVSHTGFTDQNLDTLTPLSKLQSLNLVATPVSDTSLARLESMTSLRRVYIWQSKISTDGAQSLSHARPDLAVIGAATPPPTAPAPQAAADTGEELPECCKAALAAGKTCDHPCCIEAAKAGKVCAKCLGK